MNGQNEKTRPAPHGARQKLAERMAAADRLARERMRFDYTGMCPPERRSAADPLYALTAAGKVAERKALAGGRNCTACERMRERMRLM